MDVTRRYVRNFNKWGGERTRAPEAVLLYILDEIRAAKRKDMSKKDKFKLEEEMMREYRELQGYVASAIAAEICKIIPEDFINGSTTTRTPRSDPDVSKAAEARQNSAQTEAERLGGLRASRPNGPQDPRHPHDQAPR